MKLPDWCDPDTVREVAKLLDTEARQYRAFYNRIGGDWRFEHAVQLRRLAIRLRDRATRLEKRQAPEIDPELKRNLDDFRRAIEKGRGKRLRTFGIRLRPTKPGDLIDTGEFRNDR